MANFQKYNKESGSALVYILIAIALLAALTVTFMEPSSQQTAAQNSFRLVSDIKSQVDTIRSAIQSCVLSYREGDSSIDISASGTDPFARKNFPIKPNSTHYSTATVGPTTGRYVRDIRCPGNPGGGDNNHAKVFGASSGKFLTAPPELFSDWEYYNGLDGIYFWTSTDKTDAFLTTAMEKLDEQYDECEADVIDASGGSVYLDSDNETRCESGNICFRVRMTIKDTSVYNGDDEGDEASYGCPI